ncbi:hypothetical protein IWQ56_004475 [Coemansia nantahalensis]|uniref:Uncharacterized protein n=1 Tax=Coemansia helicoidea TaxID=1286919 RepID=A0ACC1L365_9FUNG|nr:hypothetical protein IWQ56_004475 [Coemansia nantahalensis]KAJ2799978.1 hypothetical protein H4R21_003354 [Coemansia helicoidea]
MIATTPLLAALGALSSIAAAQQCSGHTAKCPGGTDGVSQTYLQCDSWSHQYVSTSCPAGQVCFANPTAPNTVMCAPPGSGTVPDQGRCTGNTAKCASAGTSGQYYQCESWAGLYVRASCPAGLRCFNGTTAGTVYCL